MATYTKTTNFTAKDNLTSGDPAKVIKGSEFDTEFNAIETAVNSKANANNGTHTGTTTISTADIDNLQIDSVAVTATAAELNTLDGITASTAELNITDGLTATTAELNTLDGITSTTAELNKLDGFTGDVTDLNKLASVTATATEINVLDGSTATTADLNKLAAVTATSTELNVLDGFTGSTAELNYVDGVTSNIQTQLDNKQPLDAQLTDIAGLTPTDGTFIVGNGTNFVAESGDTAIASLGITATATELNTLDGITATTAELNYTDGVTSNIQTQLDTKAPIASPTFTGTTTIPTVDINGGNIDGVQIGTASPNAGVFSTLNANSSFEAPNIDDNATKVDLKNGGATKLSTTSTGVDVTGTVTADGLTVNGSAVVSGVANANLQLRSIGGNIYQVRTDTNDVSIHQAQRNAPIAKFTYGGDVRFYEDTGTTAKFVWDSSAESLTVPRLNLLLSDTNSTGIIGRTDRAYIEMERADFDGSINFYTTTSGSSGITNRMTISDTGNIGIGTSSPLSIFHVGTGNDANLPITFAPASGGNTEFRSTTSTGSFTFTVGNGNSERARIDSSGNLLVGTTSAYGSDGTTIGAGEVVSKKTSFRTLTLDRLSTDGEIAQFRKDGSTVGSIGTESNELTVETAASGKAVILKGSNGTVTTKVAFSTTAGSEAFRPYNSDSDALFNLGRSDRRFKDIYLSGGVYLGGTGSANKLDDYEEGTWTPAPNSGSFSSQTGTYVKVGSLVTVCFEFVVNSGGGSIIYLPFASNQTVGGGIYTSSQDFPSGSLVPVFAVGTGTSCYFRFLRDSAIYSTLNFTSGASFHATFSYTTNA